MIARGVPWLGSALQELVPADATVATEAIGSRSVDDRELRWVRTASPSRRAEFAAGRSAARQALADTGGPDVPIPIGARGAPVWPAGWTGSISHTNHLAAAVVRRSPPASLLGVDVTPVAYGRRLTEAVDVVFGSQELPRPGLRMEPTEAVIRFTIKEAAIKVLSVDLERYIRFPEVLIRLTGPGVAHVAHQGLQLPARWRISQGHALATAWQQQ